MSENNEKKLDRELEEQSSQNDVASAEEAQGAEVQNNEAQAAEPADVAEAEPADTTEKEPADMTEKEPAERSSRKKTIRIVALAVAFAIIFCSLFIIISCSAPPKYEEIEGRFKELMENSKTANEIMFGKGLPSYERVSFDEIKFYKTGELYEENGVQKERQVSYYYAQLPKGDTKTVVAFRENDTYYYAYVTDRVQSRQALSLIFPEFEGASSGESRSFYDQIYRSEDGKTICYLVPYDEPKYDYYYSDSDPENYDYIRTDIDFSSIDDIKTYLETVYSDNYLMSLYTPLFDGVVSGGVVSVARYTEISKMGDSRLAQLNTYEPLFTEHRIYDFSTAEIKGWGSNKDTVIIKIKSYLPASPAVTYDHEITMVFEDDNWFLDTPTF